MEFSMNQKVLLKELDLLQGIGSKRAKENPIYAGVLLRVENNQLMISATDTSLTCTAICSLSSLTSTPGLIVIPADKLRDLVRSLNAQDIDFTLQDENALLVKQGRAEYELVGWPGASFPPPPSTPEYSAVIPAHVLAGQIARTKYAISQAQGQYTVQGANITLDGGLVQMVALDGKKMPVVLSKILFESEQPISALIPEQGIDHLARLLVDDSVTKDATVDFGRTANHAFFRLGSRTMSTLLLAGSFPDYKLILPKEGENDKSVILNVADFIQRLKRSMIVAGNSKEPTAVITIRNGELIVSAQAADVGKGSDPMSVESNGIDITIGFNPMYLLPPLSAMKNEKVKMEINNPEKPIVLRPIGDEMDWLCVVMPKRIL